MLMLGVMKLSIPCHSHIISHNCISRYLHFLYYIGMFLDPLAITINVQDDNNTLKVPSISHIDGRMVRDRLHSDSELDEKERINLRSTVSTPTPSLLEEQAFIMKRPVSDQNINANNKSRKEKAVSWYSKLPTSTQTLGCVEGVTEEKDFSDKHAQSQPLLGTLESRSPRRHICRHTFSVRQIRSPTKDGQKSRNLRRCVSSGNERVTFREKYLQLRPTNKVQDCSSPLTIANEAHLAKQLCSSKQNSLDDSRGEEMSLIDWAEDEKLCDEEVGNITGHCNDDDDDDIKPTLTHVGNGDCQVLNELPTVAFESDKNMTCTQLDSNVHMHSNSDTKGTGSSDDRTNSDQTVLSYADNLAVEKSMPITVNSATAAVTPALSKGQSTPHNLLLDIPVERRQRMNSVADHLKNDSGLRVGPTILDEKRPPLTKQSGDSHL